MSAKRASKIKIESSRKASFFDSLKSLLSSGPPHSQLLTHHKADCSILPPNSKCSFSTFKWEVGDFGSDTNHKYL